jgi:hypothetical protein
MFMDVRMCECIVCMKEKANKEKKSGIRPPNLFLIFQKTLFYKLVLVFQGQTKNT